MAVNFDKIVKYTINSVCESNLHIGSSVGGKEEVLVHPVTGVPFIQASSIAGVFRRNYENLYNDSDRLFGARSMNANSTASEFESRVKFTDGIFDNNSLKLEIRPHVRIDKVSGTVMQERGSGQKLEMEYVGQGSKFTMEVYLYIESKDKTAYEKSIESILSLMCKGEITFGAKKSSGSGKVIPDTIYKKVFDMTNEADRKEWNRDDEKDSSKELNNGEVIYSNTENKIDSVNESNVAYTIKISGKTEGAIMVKGIAVSEFGKGAPDCENIKNAKKENIIPGTSIRGAIRAQMEKISGYIGKKMIIKSAFGNNEGTRKIGNLVFSDVKIDNEEYKKNEIIRHRIHIDKFTGGVIASELFAEKNTCGKLSIEIKIMNGITDKAETDATLGLLLLALRDLTVKNMSFGGGYSVGKGFIDVDEITISDSEKCETFYSNGKSESSDCDFVKGALAALREVS